MLCANSYCRTNTFSFILWLIRTMLCGQRCYCSLFKTIIANPLRSFIGHIKFLTLSIVTFTNNLFFVCHGSQNTISLSVVGHLNQTIKCTYISIDILPFFSANKTVGIFLFKVLYVLITNITNKHRSTPRSQYYFPLKFSNDNSGPV